MNKKTQNEILEIVKRNYSEIAGHYSETRKKKIWPELEELTKKIKNGDKILDVGCGSGKLLQALENKEIDYYGVDSCREILDNAEEINKNKGGGERKFAKGDILNLGDIPEVNFDYVFCIAVLHHLPGKDLQIQAIKQLKNKIKPGGEIVLSVWNLWSDNLINKKKKFKKQIFKFLFLKIIGKNKMDFGDVLFDWKNSKGEITSKRYYHAFTKRQLKKISKKAGLKIKKIYKDKYNYYLTLNKK